MAGGAATAVSLARTHPVTRETEEEAFRRGLVDLLERFDRTVADDASEPYAGAGIDAPLEHTTRIHLLDSLAELLGWQLGLGGNMVEEARLKNGTTTFMDYLGVAAATNAPVLLIEAKAWDKPFITPRASGAGYDYHAELIAEAIDHWRRDGDKTTSPAVGDWHDYMEQVGRYVKGLRAHGHPLPRAVITSGQWLVVFTKPVATFIDGPASAADIRIFRKQDYCARALEMHSLLSKASLCVETPYHIRATQVLSYITPEAVLDCFHALHLSYEISGSPFFTKRPRILVYPALVLQRNDGALLTVLENSDPLYLSYQNGIDDLEQALEPHLGEVAAAAEALLKRTGEQLGLELQPSALDDFPGYPINTNVDRVKSKSLIKRHAIEPDVWMLITGQVTHFLKPMPDVACRYHRWSACHAADEAIGTAAVSMPQIARPRSFFTDGQPHHCAHQGLKDRREGRCQIPLIDERLCCKSCLFAPVCWPGTQLTPLPCGTT
ncbi:hypothetical protein ACQUQQ_00980 [Acidithiobacillus ferrooxidans]|uniref:hypothetical protein n=1 Tax=Acidithiobacillus TaxID=119977 RepID=UPI001C076131|nr:hypothetical protein [Acidithiobacillus ferridurans]MBU2803631.1 hypothetical protein [Acidithiobacillus ferridurans]